MLQGAQAFFTIADRLVTAISDALTTSLGGAPERACVVPGEIAWDECECGMLAVSPNRWLLSDSFPSETSSGEGRITPCDLPWLVGELNIQIVRCAPSPANNSFSVPCARLSEAAQTHVSDAYVTLTTTVLTLCEMKSDEEIVDYVISDQTSVGPQGSCVGTELVALVSIYR